MFALYTIYIVGVLCFIGKSTIFNQLRTEFVFRRSFNRTRARVLERSFGGAVVVHGVSRAGRGSFITSLEHANRGWFVCHSTDSEPRRSRRSSVADLRKNAWLLGAAESENYTYIFMGKTIFSVESIELL